MAGANAKSTSKPTTAKEPEHGAPSLLEHEPKHGARSLLELRLELVLELEAARCSVLRLISRYGFVRIVSACTPSLSPWPSPAASTAPWSWPWSPPTARRAATTSARDLRSRTWGTSARPSAPAPR